jgi:dTDP-glucose pyrophosphorylase
MSNVQETMVGPTATIKEVVETIERSVAKVALVVDERRRLIGTVTDGDIRRGLLRSIDLDEPVTRIMNPNPHTASLNDSQAIIVDIMRRNICRQVPIIDSEGCVVALKTLEELLRVPKRPNWVFLMAGGQGQRLRPLTEDCPKPMLPIGGRPILEIIVESLARQGFSRYFISVNYRRDMIKRHFGDGSRWNVRIDYIEEAEDRPLGTAGALSLLPSVPDHPMLVVNGDILTKVPFDSLLDFHLEHGSCGTMCVRDYILQVPYGVIETDDHRLAEIVEKPIHRLLVNAGIYVLDAKALALVPRDVAYDMPTLFEEMRRSGLGASVFPIREYWLDIGRVDDFNRANAEYSREFLDFDELKPT